MDLILDKLEFKNTKIEGMIEDSGILGVTHICEVDNTKSPVKYSKFDRNDDSMSRSLNPFCSPRKSAQELKKFDKNAGKVRKNLNFSCENPPFFLDACAFEGSDSSWAYLDSSILKKLMNNNQKTEEYLKKFNNSELIKRISLD